MIGKKVVVTTIHRGVFFGEIESRDGDTVILKQARNCLRWHQSVKGFLGLAATGPSDNCRVGPACDKLELLGVASISLCSDRAVRSWEAAPWGG